MKKSLSNPPAPKSSDVIEAAEMVRAALACLRQSFGIAFMVFSNGYFKSKSESDVKQFTVQFDDVNKFLRETYDACVGWYNQLKKSES